MREHALLPALWRRVHGERQAVLADGCVIFSAWFSDGRMLREAIDFWLGTDGSGPLFFITFCRDAGRAFRILQAFADEGLKWAAELALQWPSNLPGIHPMRCGDGKITVHMGLGDFEAWLAAVDAEVDFLLVDFVGADPLSAPGNMTRHLARLAKCGASLRMRFLGDDPCGFRRDWTGALRGSGFREWSNEGGDCWDGVYVGKKSFLRGEKAVEKNAIVVGGGVAGVSVSASLANRGWRVDLLEACETIASGASGNLAAVCVPMLSRDDGISARLSRAGFLYLDRELKRLGGLGVEVLHGFSGVLQFPRMARDAAVLEEAVKMPNFPGDYVCWWSVGEIARRFQCEAEWISSGAAFFPGAGWINPASLCEARLRVSANVRVQLNARVGEVRRVDGLWEVLSESGRSMARAPVLILAAGNQVLKWPQCSGLRLKCVRGQVTHIDEGHVKTPPWVVCGDGYVIPRVKGTVSVGATYDFGNEGRDVLESSGIQNLNRISALLPFRQQVDERFALQGRVGFRTLTADRLPVVGGIPDMEKVSDSRRPGRLEKIPRLPGFYGFLGLGSRGILWSGLGAECLASQITGEPLPLERDLADAMDPARWVLRAGRG